MSVLGRKQTLARVTDARVHGLREERYTATTFRPESGAFLKCCSATCAACVRLRPKFR